MAIYVAKNGSLQTIKGIYYGMTEDYINATRFHNLVPKTATEIQFLYASNNHDLTGYQRIGYCDNNNYIEVWNNNTKYIIINPRKNYIYAPVSCNNFLAAYNALINCVFDNFDTRNTTNMAKMFNGCSDLTSLDLSSFNTANVTVMQEMFYKCTRLTTMDLSSFNTQNVTNMHETFFGVGNFQNLDLNISNFNTQKVTDFIRCFENTGIVNLDISNFTTPAVVNIYQMFRNSSKLRSIKSQTFVLGSNANSTAMFLNCTSLVGGNGTTYSSSHTDAEYARVDGEDGLAGYFTAPTN